MAMPTSPVSPTAPLSLSYLPLATMVQCNGAECTEEGKSQCGRCKKSFYCSAKCQQKDWSAHKKECKRLTTNATPSPPQISPFPQIFNILSGTSTPMSATAVFFAPMFGYTATNPEPVYKDLVNAYRLLRLGAHLNAHRVPPALQGIDFADWMDRITLAKVLPEWWDAAVNGAGIETYTREDAWGRLDRVVTREEVAANAQKRLMTLEMMVERILNNSL
ncbi:N-lysine methyltransferase SMYD2 [Mycena venus]|uniref:N-lysine methyltransferase SMYD2 n=1 Tax=Mycena venus TaxID=2733690 RepID=A0A8H7DBZ3_9AGAR|nr:N-lysine methyltransferase SMYD2 [Mycena venus]